MDLFGRIIQNPALRGLIAARRALRGPKLPTWTLDMEVACEFMRFYAPISKRLDPARMRSGVERLLGDAAPPEGMRLEAGIIANCRAAWFIPEEERHDAVLYYLHGGGYAIGSLRTHQGLISSFCRAAGTRALALDYRLAPEHPFPAAIEDAVAGYRYLLAQGISPRRIVVMGDSAGGGLAMSLLLRLRALRVPMPAAAALFSPWVDLSGTSATLRHYRSSDYITRDYLDLCADWVLGGAARSHPLISTIHADLHGLPPLLVQVGGAEGLLDDSLRLAARAREHGVDVTLDVHPDMVHVFQLFAGFAPEARRALCTVGQFVRERAGTPQSFAAVAQ